MGEQGSGVLHGCQHAGEQVTTHGQVVREQERQRFALVIEKVRDLEGLLESTHRELTEAILQMQEEWGVQITPTLSEPLSAAFDVLDGAKKRGEAPLPA